MIQFFKNHQNKLWEALFESVGKAVGGIIVVVVIYFLPFNGFEKLTSIFEKNLNLQTESVKKIADDIDHHHHDTLTVKNETIKK